MPTDPGAGALPVVVVVVVLETTTAPGQPHLPMTLVGWVRCVVVLETTRPLDSPTYFDFIPSAHVPCTLSASSSGVTCRHQCGGVGG